jgi:glyoxylase-like metal-dependent hydrolase (beta-lactamase superfamily II)
VTNVRVLGGSPQAAAALASVDSLGFSPATVAAFTGWADSVASDPAIVDFSLNGIWNVAGNNTASRSLRMGDGIVATIQTPFARVGFDSNRSGIGIRLLDGDTDVFGDGSVTLVSTPGHTPGSQSLLAHLKNSGFIVLSGDVVHLEKNFEKGAVPSLNTDSAASIASMERIRRIIATYKAKLFINHDKAQSDTLKLLPAFYD